MRGVAEPALPALVGRTVGSVLGNVFVELKQVLSGEAADGTFMNFENVDLQLLERLGDGASRGPEF